MDTLEIKEFIRRELPRILREDEEMRQYVLQIAQTKFADKVETESRFDRMLAELQRDREENQKRWEANQQELRALREEQNEKWQEQNKKWEANQQELRTLREEQNKKWEEQNKKWAEQDKRWNEQNKRWNEQNKRWDGQDKKWDEQNKRWDGQDKKWDEQDKRWNEQNEKWAEQNKKWAEQNRKWDANQVVINQILESIKALNRKHDSTIGALGARWGTRSEYSFREALKGILEDSFGITVENITEYDEAGDVFGHPDQIELDIIIKNGLLIICEIKSSMSKGDMFIFAKKIKFYEKRHNKTANRKIAISPMVDQYAQPVAQREGIEVYSYAEDIEAL